jgi:hypothetical protein
VRAHYAVARSAEWMESVLGDVLGAMRVHASR